MPSKPYSQVAILLSRMGKRGIEPPVFTTWEQIYSLPQHRQSLPLPHNRHQTVSNLIFRAMRCTMRLFKVRFVLPPIYTPLFCPQAVAGLLLSEVLMPLCHRISPMASYSQNIDHLQADSIIWPNRWVRIYTSHDNDSATGNTTYRFLHCLFNSMTCS